MIDRRAKATELGLSGRAFSALCLVFGEWPWPVTVREMREKLSAPEPSPLSEILKIRRCGRATANEIAKWLGIDARSKCPTCGHVAGQEGDRLCLAGCGARVYGPQKYCGPKCSARERMSRFRSRKVDE